MMSTTNKTRLKKRVLERIKEQVKENMKKDPYNSDCFWKFNQDKYDYKDWQRSIKPD